LLSKNIKIKIYGAIISPVVLYGCEAWSHTLKEEHRLMVFKTGVLRKIFGPKRDKVIGEWRRVRNEELYAVYFSPNIIWVIKSRRLRWAGCVACMGNRTGAYRVLMRRLRERDHLEDGGVDSRIMLK
jgi:hypothetical protein